MSRMSVSSRTREGMLLTAPGKTSQTPTVPTVSIAPVRFGGGFERKNQLSCGGQRIFAAGHQLAAGMAAFAFDEDAHAGGRGDVGHEADIDAFLFEERALLDVQLDELMKAARRVERRIRACP